MGEVTMPKMGEAMEEGTLIRWLKKEGEEVTENEPIAEIETDKAAMEIPSFVTGTISRLLFEEGAVVPVGQPIAGVLEPGETEAIEAPTASTTDAGPAEEASPATDQAVEASQAEQPPGVLAHVTNPETVQETPPQPPKEETRAPSAAPGAPIAPPSPEEAAPAAGNGDRVLASPLAKKIAADAGVDLRALQGTGPNGRIVEADVKEYLQRTPEGAPRTAQPAPPTTQPATPPAPQPAPQPMASQHLAAPRDERKLSTMRKTIARRLLESKQSIPHFYVTTEIDMGAAQEFHAQLKAAQVEGRAKSSIVDMIVKACALALVKYPDVNAQFTGEAIRYPANVNIGYAITVEGGLMVPVIRECERKTLHQIAGDRRALVEKTQAGKLTPPEYEGGTFTISNMGTFDVESFIAIVNPPQSAILAVGSILDQVVAVDGQMEIRPRMKVTLSADHRVVDGVLAAQFLQELKRLLQNPISLVE
ncbi:MAG: 2-oxo acid dehydrogenase subunit E2 [Armatimonadetes bacterium]|nr:2-oxo acid dehydrogenase subunit E2 [Armatimonadota bacterium]